MASSSSDTRPEAKPESASATTTISLEERNSALNQLAEMLDEMVILCEKQGDYNVDAAKIRFLASGLNIVLRAVMELTAAKH